jgi:hypothetical protein
MLAADFEQGQCWKDTLSYVRFDIEIRELRRRGVEKMENDVTGLDGGRQAIRVGKVTLKPFHPRQVLRK